MKPAVHSELVADGHGRWNLEMPRWIKKSPTWAWGIILVFYLYWPSLLALDAVCGTRMIDHAQFFSSEGAALKLIAFIGSPCTAPALTAIVVFVAAADYLDDLAFSRGSVPALLVTLGGWIPALVAAFIAYAIIRYCKRTPAVRCPTRSDNA